ncbi:hypothetical protein GCM10022280_07370 [Sphingomonas swuensis]|uniref:Uncharacterized protein n=1 Tax=Sphingomonas swuensis TaxID=977800 RepID=A0ABP7SI61_9SPHN
MLLDVEIVLLEQLEGAATERALVLGQDHSVDDSGGHGSFLLGFGPMDAPAEVPVPSGLALCRISD